MMKAAIAMGVIAFLVVFGFLEFFEISFESFRIKLRGRYFQTYQGDYRIYS